MFPKYVSTAQLGQALGLQPDTIRRHHSLSGAFLGIVPVKLPNGRLLWPAEKVAELVKGEGDDE